MAIDYNREVFAVPGPIDNANWRGSHQLIKDGAHLIECAEDVLELLGSRSGISGGPVLKLPQEGTSSKWLWDRIDLSGAPLADLQMQWPGDPADLAEGLLALEMANMAIRLPGAKVARTVWTSSDRK